MRLPQSGARPDETTALTFRQLRWMHDQGEKQLERIRLHRVSHGHQLKTGMTASAGISTVLSSPKSRKGELHPRMRPPPKDNQWQFRMQAHIGVNTDSGLATSAQTTLANVSDAVTAPPPLHGAEDQVWSDAGYQDAGKREEARALEVGWRVAFKAGKRRRPDKA